jgi:hypothetical protein
MSTAKDVVKELNKLGSEGYRSVLRRHGAKDPLFGVKISELKKIQKRIKCDHQLALELYAAGIYDAMYLAGLIVDDHQMSKSDLQRWVEQANCAAISESTVACAAAAGWATLNCVIALTAAKRIGTITLDMGDTACKVPSAVEHINKAKLRSAIGKKRKTVKC